MSEIGIKILEKLISHWIDEYTNNTSSLKKLKKILEKNINRFSIDLGIRDNGLQEYISNFFNHEQILKEILNHILSNQESNDYQLFWEVITKDWQLLGAKKPPTFDKSSFISNLDKFIKNTRKDLENNLELDLKLILDAAQGSNDLKSEKYFDILNQII